MSKADMLILSAGEIYVMAGLMGYPSVMAVGSETLREWYPALRRHVRETMSDLERRMLVLAEPSGAVYLSGSAAAAIRCLCEPDRAVCLTGSIRSGKSAALYLMRRGDTILKVQCMAPGSYRLDLAEPDEVDALLNQLFDGVESLPLDETLPLEAAERVRVLLEGFDRSGAAELLGGMLKNPECREDVLDALSGTNRYLRIQVLGRCDGYYACVWRLLCTQIGKRRIGLALDTEEMLHLSDVSPEQFRSAFWDAFGAVKKGPQHG